jgi:3-methyladenine DNA glycosylase AlkD
VTSVAGLDVRAEVAGITAALAARRDPSYEWGMRRTVPSQQPAHATRVPDIRKTGSEWRKAHKGIDVAETFALCDALWDTGWREERLVAIDLIRVAKAARETVGWERLERWSEDIDNWEQVDHLADLTGRLLIADRSLLAQTKALESSENPWQRRLALVTLIVAFMKGAVFREELAAMAERRAKDAHPLVRRAVVWARDWLKKDHLDD